MKRSVRYMILSVVVFSTMSPGLTQNTTSGVGMFDEAAFRARIKFLSDDVLEGRGTGSRGGEIATKYIASEFEKMGLKGAGLNGNFFQPVSFVGVKADPNTVLKLSGGNGSESFKFADNFVA